MQFSLLEVKQGHLISLKFQSLSREQTAFDAHPANFYYHTIELYQTTACLFSNEMYIKQCIFASLWPLNNELNMIFWVKLSWRL